MKSEHYLNSKGEQIDFTVKVYTRPNLRDGVNEFLMYMGKAQLETMFDKCVIDPTVKTIHFEYPERWANILEQRAIPERMLVCFPNLEQVVIVTHSVYIIQCVLCGHVLVYGNPEDYPETNYADLKTRFCPLPESLKGLMVVTPEEAKIIKK